MGFGMANRMAVAPTSSTSIIAGNDRWTGSGDEPLFPGGKKEWPDAASGTGSVYGYLLVL